MPFRSVRSLALLLVPALAIAACATEVESGGGLSTDSGTSSAGGGSGGDGGALGHDGGASDARADASPDAAAPVVCTYHLSPTGSDAGAGSQGAPWFSLSKAWTVLKPGDTLCLHGGTYRYTKSQYLQGLSGTAGKLVRIWAVPGEVPVLTRDPSYTIIPGQNQDLIYLEGDYLHWRGIDISGFSQRPGEIPFPAFRAGYTNHSIFEAINYHHNMSGLQVRGDSTDNLFLNSDFHHNQDPYGSDGNGKDAFDGADGLDLTFNNDTTGAPNIIRGCRAYWNADDGFDLWDNNGSIVIEGSWAFYNGYVPDTFNHAGNGTAFKLGTTSKPAILSKYTRTIKNNLAYRNYFAGFVENDSPTKFYVYNNTSVLSGYTNYWFGAWNNGSTAVVRNNIDHQGGEAPGPFNGGSLVDHNSWNGHVVNDNDFESLDASQLLLPRLADGSLPQTTFLRLAPNSDLVDTGMDVGLPYLGTAPDIGAFERK